MTTTPPKPTCPVCKTTLGKRTGRMPNGTRAHLGCVALHRARTAPPEPIYDRAAERRARALGDVL